MAIYEGARPRTIFLPPRRADRRARELPGPQAPALPRRRARVTIRAHRRPRLIGLVLGAIALAFLLSFFSLVQTVRVSASDYDASVLHDEYSNLLRERQQVSSELDRVGSEPAIRHAAIQQGLTQLPPPVVLPAK